MKKFIFAFIIMLGLSQLSHAQFGIKAGVNYNNNGDATLGSAGSDLLEGADAKSGYHAGIWFRAKLPILGLYIRPEIIYTDVKSEYNLNGTAAEYEFNKIDVPVLLGTKVLGFGNVFIGPAFQYIIEDNLTLSDLSTDEFDKFSLGMQLGFGVEFGAVGIDVRWERGLTNTEANFASNNLGLNNIDNRTNQIIFGLSLKL